VLFSILNQRNPDYRARTWQELELLYRGGYDLTLREVEAFLPRHIGEHVERYAERVRSASYVPYFAQICDYFAAALFSHRLSITPGDEKQSAPDMAPYDEFAEDCDLKGHTLDRCLRDVFVDALVFGKGLIAVDFPQLDAEMVSRADEDRAGLGIPYAYQVPVEQLIDWEYADDGTYKWAILKREVISRESPTAARDKCHFEFMVWQRDGEFARWELYRTEPRPLRAHMQRDPKEDVPLVADGVTSFRRVPIVTLHMPSGLWVGNKVGPLAKEHFRRRSALVAAEAKSLFSIPYVKLGPEIGGVGDPLPSEAQQNPWRGRDPRLQLENKGYMVLGAGDDIGFAEPNGHAYELVDKQVGDLVDEMFRIVHQMAFSVSSTSSSLGRSGLSKSEDRRATETVLAAFGELVRDFAVRLYDTVAEARGDDVYWQAHGLDNFKIWDRDELLREGVEVDRVNIPSPTFKRLYKGEIALRILGDVTPDVAQTIRDEIEAAQDDIADPIVEAEQTRADYEAGLVTRQTALQRIAKFYDGIDNLEAYERELAAESHSLADAEVVIDETSEDEVADGAEST
tara:strand:+ start:796 stop:2505 length:1710 start_codon:yes stop_codon:yes gene_type:complete